MFVAVENWLLNLPLFRENVCKLFANSKNKKGRTFVLPSLPKLPGLDLNQ